MNIRINELKKDERLDVKLEPNQYVFLPENIKILEFYLLHGNEPEVKFEGLWYEIIEFSGCSNRDIQLCHRQKVSITLKCKIHKSVRTIEGIISSITLTDAVHYY